MSYTDTSIDINEFSERHQGIEAARKNLETIEPMTQVETDGSQALEEFRKLVVEFASLVGDYKLKLWNDSRELYQTSNLFIEKDMDLAREYENTMRESLWQRHEQKPPWVYPGHSFLDTDTAKDPAFRKRYEGQGGRLR